MTNTPPWIRSEHSASSDENGEPTLKRRAIVTPSSVPPSSVPPSSPAPWYLSFLRSRDFIPLALLVGFLFISLITALTQAYKYGITIDEPLQEQYGKAVLKWYLSFGKNTSFITGFRRTENMPEHGGVFDAVVVAIQYGLKFVFKGIDLWLVRHVVTGFMGWLGIVGIALCGLELGGPWVAFAAATGLWLFPRYYGAMFNNPKDVPGAATLTFVIWATLLLVKHWKRRDMALKMSALLGFFLGVATAIRVTALSWFAVLVVLIVAWWLINGRSALRERRVVAELVHQAAVAATIGVSTLLTTMALWPFVFINPIGNLLESVIVLSHYPWIGPVLLDGQIYPSTQLPLSYIPIWIFIGSPPMLLVLAVLGVVVILAETVRRRRVESQAWTGLAGFAILMAPLLLLHPVLYDTLRQFLYIFPPLILLGAYGLVRSVTWLRGQRRAALRWTAVALLAVTVVSYVQVITDMMTLSPYEYAYFSPLIGGIKGAPGLYETDYYGSCSMAAAKWLAQNYHHYTSSSTPTVGASFLLEPLIQPYLPSTVHYTDANPNFFIGFTRYNNDQSYPAYHLVDVVSTDGVPLCVVKVNPALFPGK